MGRAPAYLLALGVAAFELYVLALALNPEVSEDYRAFYIERTSTCLPQPVDGQYVLGETISFKDGEREKARPLKPCGWFEPNGDGTPTKGESAMLRFAVGPDAGPLRLTITASPVIKDDRPVPQRVVVAVGGSDIAAFTVSAKSQRHSVDIPAQAGPAAGRPLDVTLKLPDSLSFERGGRGSNTQERALVVHAVRLGKAPP